jgi:primosomal protein N' (replication factor Y)
MESQNLLGCRVSVPLRRRKVLGTVIRVCPIEGQENFALRPLAGLMHPKPLVPPTLLELAVWMADYYACRLEVVVRGMIPEMIRTGAGGFKTQKAVRLKREPTSDELEALRKRAPRQAALLEELAGGKTVLLAALAAAHAAAPQAVKKLEEAGWIEVRDEIQARDPAAAEQFLASEPLPLNAEQAAALRAVELDLEAEPADKKPILLKGVTGSGKTEVYLQAIAGVMDRGQSVIVLVPEISLTPQTTERFKRRFAAEQDRVAILHSHLSEGERHDEWRKILDGKARIVIGARSAIFAPLENVGLIVVDEEHENTYKQENPPRYQGRDVAVVRGRIEGATVLLGSATPSLESWRNCLTGKYRLVELTKRADDQKMPVIRVIDMRSEGRGGKDGREKKGTTILSEPLRIAIEQRLARREQVILFLNRRGYSPSVLCQDCGHRVECPHCSVTLTYHEADSRLICHLCGFQRIPLRKCPECGSPSIFFAGYGTERVEQVLRKVFPRARIARIDTDTMKRKTQLQETLNDFKALQYDLLIGTQMIAKGLHFPNVTLVGVLNADVGLHVPDFRAGERTFQLLTQVAGRAGRGHLLGEVVVQTFTPQNPSIQYARHHDFEGFAGQELPIREAQPFPPFVHVALVTARSEHERRAQFTAETLHKRLAADLPEDILLSAPMPSPLVRVANQFRFQLLLRAKNPRRMVAHVRKHLDALTFPEDVIVTVDVDAYNLS